MINALKDMQDQHAHFSRELAERHKEFEDLKTAFQKNGRVLPAELCMKIQASLTRQKNRLDGMADIIANYPVA